MMDGKIVSCEALPELRKKYFDKKIILSHGTWDIVHPGIFGHLEEARSLGDILVVTLTADEYISKKRHIAFTEDLRARQIANLALVDHVAIIYEPSAMTPIKLLNPDFYVKGGIYKELLIDPTKNISHEKKEVEKYGGQIYFTSHETYSSVKISHFLMESPEALQQSKFYFGPAVRFEDISENKFSINEIHDFIEDVEKLKVCVIGDCIIDEWKYLKLHSISQKSKCMSGEEQRTQQQIGGAGVIALDVSAFAKSVDFYSNDCSIWNDQTNIEYFKVNEGRLIKTRFINAEDEKVLFESKQLSIKENGSDAFAKIDFNKYDVVLVADFGHGLIGEAEKRAIVENCSVEKLACMIQANSSNFGFNTPLKFHQAAYHCMNRIEAALCLRRKDLPQDVLFDKVGQILNADSYAVTFGAEGSMVKTGEDVSKLPALSNVIVDNIGCGDAFFALSAIAVIRNKGARLANLLGSLGSAIMSQRHGNAMPITAQEVIRLAEIVI